MSISAAISLNLTKKARGGRVAYDATHFLGERPTKYDNAWGGVTVAFKRDILFWAAPQRIL